MNYISKITIQNFQSHENSELELDPGLNVIVGPSDQGKSAIIRAIKWVLFNEPRGNEFIRHGSNFARVTVEMSNAYIVTRERSPSKNRYTVTDPEGKSDVYEGFGNEVPDEVKKAHRIFKVVIDVDSDVSLNLGEQLESPFLMSETGSVKAKAIGRLTGVHVIDKAIRECINDIKRETQVENRCLKEIEELDEKLKSYENLEQLRNEIDDREKLLKTLEGQAERLEQLQKLRIVLGQVSAEQEKSRKLLEQLDRVDKAELIIYKLSEKIERFKRLNNLRTNYSVASYEARSQEDMLIRTTHFTKASEKLKVLEEKISSITGLKRQSERYKQLTNTLSKTNKELNKYRMLHEAEKNLVRILELIELKEKLENLSKTIKSVDLSIKEGNNYVLKVKDEIGKTVKEYEEHLKKISRCPVCFNEIDEKTVNKVVLKYKEGL